MFNAHPWDLKKYPFDRGALIKVRFSPAVPELYRSLLRGGYYSEVVINAGFTVHWVFSSWNVFTCFNENIRLSRSCFWNSKEFHVAVLITFANGNWGDKTIIFVCQRVNVIIDLKKKKENVIWTSGSQPGVREEATGGTRRAHRGMQNSKNLTQMKLIRVEFFIWGYAKGMGVRRGVHFWFWYTRVPKGWEPLI